MQRQELNPAAAVVRKTIPEWALARSHLLIALGRDSSEEELEISGSPGHFLQEELGVRYTGKTHPKRGSGNKNPGNSRSSSPGQGQTGSSRSSSPGQLILLDKSILGDRPGSPVSICRGSGI